MNTYGDRLAHALLLAKCDRATLGRDLDISIQAIGQVIAGKTKALNAENSARAAKFLDVDHFWLATGEGEPLAHKKKNAEWPFGEFSRYLVLSDSKKTDLGRIVESFLSGAEPEDKPQHQTVRPQR